MRNTLLKVAKALDKEQVNPAAVPVSPNFSKLTGTGKKTAVISFESKLMNSFHVGDPVVNQINIAKFVSCFKKSIIIVVAVK